MSILSTITAPFTGQLWKLGTIGAGLVALLLSGLLMASSFENRDLQKQRTQLVAQITDPKTGYVAQLAQAHTNVATLTKELDDQQKSFQDKADQREAVLKVTQAQLDAAQAKTASMEKRLSGFLATKPQGATLEDRIHDIDARGMSEMVQ